MSTNHYRAALCVLNLGLVVAIAALGLRTWRGAPSPPSETPPADFRPIMYEIRSEGGMRSSVEEHRVTWQELDKPLPPPPPMMPTEAAPTQPTPQDLTRLYTLVMASYNARNPELSSFIIQGRDGVQRTFCKGDSFDGYVVVDIQVQGDGDSREAIVTVESRTGGRDTIRLQRRGAP